VVLLALKKAEDGDGFVLRLIEMEGRGTRAKVTIPHLLIGGAFEANLVEEIKGPLFFEPHSVEIVMGPYAIATIRLNMELEI
jgi:alpha-mannosidase